jgi:hypothetical protein
MPPDLGGAVVRFKPLYNLIPIAKVGIVFPQYSAFPGLPGPLAGYRILKGLLVMSHIFGPLAYLLAGVLALAAIALAGCDHKGSTAGGPGATDPSAKPPRYGEADNTFNLSAPSMSIKQGDIVQGTIGIKRGTNFAQDVSLAIQNLPKGITLDSSSLAIKSGGTDAQFKLTASDEAVPGEFTINVVGHPTNGGDATIQFTLTVEKKDSFTLSMPFWTTGLKQGETKAVSISITREKRFDQDVTLKFDGLPKGITVEPASAVIKNGETEAKFALKAVDEAALGSFSVVVTGHPTKGADASHEFKFTIAKK